MHKCLKIFQLASLCFVAMIVLAVAAGLACMTFDLERFREIIFKFGMIGAIGFVISIGSVAIIQFHDEIK